MTTSARYRSVLFVPSILALSACGGGGGGPGGTGTIVPTCDGSGLVGDPTTRPACTPPASPTNGCASPQFSIRRGRNAQAETDAFMEAETSVAFDPREGSQLVYAATLQATIGPASPASTYPTSTCIIQKRIRVYVSTDLGVNWKEMEGNDDLLASSMAPNADTGLTGFWATDPDLSVGGDGTLYLTFMKIHSNPICSTSTPVAVDLEASVQLWFAAPGGRLQPALPTPAGFRAPNAAVTTKPSGLDGPLDHPKVAASPTPGIVVVYHLDLAAGDTFVTFSRQGSTFVETNRFILADPETGEVLRARFFQIAFDAAGDLYIAGKTPFAEGPRSVARLRLQSNPTRWDFVDAGHVPLTGSIHSGVSLPAPVPVGFANDPTPAIAIGKLGASSDSIVYVATTTIDENQQTHTEIAAANTSDLSVWTTPAVINPPPGSFVSFFPHMSVSGSANFLDLILYNLNLRAGAPAPANPPSVPLSDLILNSLLYRFDAARLFTPGTSATDWLLSGPTVVNQRVLPTSLLPSRGSNRANNLFPGEYLGLASKGRYPIFSWPDLRPGVEFPVGGTIDLGLASHLDTCPSGMTSVDPDNIWDCNCTCSGQATRVRGCAKGTFTTAAQACGPVCAFIGCPSSHFMCAASGCTSNQTGVILSRGTCTVGDGPPLGGNPSTRADYAASASGLSQATLTVGGTVSTTQLLGNLYLNASTSPPIGTAELEIGLLDLRPTDVFVGGNVNALLRNIKVAERVKIRGRFTDATHFRVDPGFVDLMITLQTEPSEGEISAPINFRVSNSTPALGELNLASGQVSLDATASDGAGNSAVISFRGPLTLRPTDSNGNGIADPIDTCPGATFGPDRTPPQFTFVPPSITTSACSGLNPGHATAVDPCGVTITNDAPAAFPIGTTLVRWTARDNAGNTTVATQTVTVSLGDDPSCCPAGTHIILGTSNNNTLTGTAGSDCILGRGGQDTINGGGGNDYISGGDGDDILSGQDGNDTIFGGSGQDRLFGGIGQDTLYGGDGTDTVNGDDGNDKLFGGEGQDTLNGGAGNDSMLGGVGDDVISGGLGNDTCSGGPNNDRVNGDAGDDQLFGDEGDDRLDGGTGKNFFVVGGGHDICMDNGLTLAVCPDNEN